MGEHAGLARAGAGDDQQRAALVQDGLALLRVEPVEQVGQVGADGAGSWHGWLDSGVDGGDGIASKGFHDTCQRTWARRHHR